MLSSNDFCGYLSDCNLKMASFPWDVRHVFWNTPDEYSRENPIEKTSPVGCANHRVAQPTIGPDAILKAKTMI